MMYPFHPIHFPSCVYDQVEPIWVMRREADIKRNVDSFKHICVSAANVRCTKQFPGTAVFKDSDSSYAVVFIQIFLSCCNIKSSRPVQHRTSPQWKRKLYCCYIGNIKIGIAGGIIYFPVSFDGQTRTGVFKYYRQFLLFPLILIDC